MKKKSEVCIIAQFPPPIHGLSKAVQMLYDSDLNDKFNFKKINITNNYLFPVNLIKLIFCKSKVMYLTISSSRWGNFRDLIILKLAILKKRRVVLHLHGSYYRKLIENDIPNWQKMLNYSLLRKISAAIVLSDSLKSIFEGIVDQKKIFVVSNCVDGTLIPDRIDIERKLKKKKKRRRVLYLSNLIKSKGYREVLKLANLEKKNFLKTGIRNFEFDFAGKFYGNEKKFFFDYIKENKLYNYVTYKGVVSGEKKIKLLREDDIFVLLTNYPKEGQPISILEAMANGLYIVTTNHGGISDFVNEDTNGMVIDKNNIDISMIYKRLQNLKDSELETVGKNCYRKIESFYLEKQYLKNLENIFQHEINTVSGVKK